MKILIVDDVALIRRTLEQVVGRHGFAAVTADCATAALKILQNDHSIEAVITDLHMPDLNGIELFSEAQKIERYTDEGIIPNPPFILLTADRDPKWSQLATDLGFAQVMQKPPDENQLIAELSKIHEECLEREAASEVPEEDRPNNLLACPLPRPEPILAEDVVVALNTLREAIDVLVAFDETNTLYLLRDNLANETARLDRAIEAIPASA